MGVSRFLGKFFGGFLIFIAMAVIFSGLFIQYSLDNIDVLAKSAETNLPKILQENKEVFAERMSEALDIDKAQLERACEQKPEQFTGDFCSKLGTLETEKEIQDELLDVMILKMQDQMQPEIKEFEKEIKSKMGVIGNNLNYVIPIGLFILLLGSFLIFLTEKFKCIPTTFYVSLKIGIITGFMSVGNYFLKTLTPGKIEEIASALPMIQEGATPDLAVKLISALLTDWLRVVGEKLFMVSITVAIVSFAVAVIMFILKRKKKSKANNSKKEVKASVVKKESKFTFWKKKPKKEMEIPVVEKKSKIVFSKKK